MVIDEKKDMLADLPTRLIRVTAQKWSVVNTAGDRGRYATLSYCWGGVHDILTLKTDNVELLRLEQLSTYYRERFRTPSA